MLLLFLFFNGSTGNRISKLISYISIQYKSNNTMGRQLDLLLLKPAIKESDFDF